MNWNKCLRIAIQCILLTTLATVTFIQLLKYMEGNTNISISYEERDLNLPSLTICPRYEGANEKQRNMTFDDYMKGVLNMSEIFDYVYQYNYLPGESLASSQNYGHSKLDANSLLMQPGSSGQRPLFRSSRWMSSANCLSHLHMWYRHFFHSQVLPMKVHVDGGQGPDSIRVWMIH